jgi:hypothetical protein
VVAPRRAVMRWPCHLGRELCRRQIAKADIPQMGSVDTRNPAPRPTGWLAPVRPLQRAVLASGRSDSGSRRTWCAAPPPRRAGIRGNGRAARSVLRSSRASRATCSATSAPPRSAARGCAASSPGCRRGRTAAAAPRCPGRPCRTAASTGARSCLPRRWPSPARRRTLGPVPGVPATQTDRLFWAAMARICTGWQRA